MKLIIWFVCMIAVIEYITTFYLMRAGQTDARLREANPFLRACMRRLGFWPFQVGRLVAELALFWFIATYSNWIPFAIVLPGLLFVTWNNVRIINELL